MRYAIRHKASGKVLAKGGQIGFAGRVLFMDTLRPKLYATIEAAKKEMEAMSLCMAGLSVHDLEVIDTKNTIEKSQWEAIEE